MFKNQKGITLIALIITIIVLLILAGITIALITSRDSAPDKAAQSKIVNDVGAAKDTIALNAASLMTDYYSAKYVATTGNADANNANALKYYDANTTTTTGLFLNVDENKITVTDLTAAGSFAITSKETVSNGGKAYQYKQEGTVNENGGITWTTPAKVNDDLGAGWVEKPAS